MKGPVQYYRPYSGRDTTCHIDEDCTNTVESGCLLCRCPSPPPTIPPPHHQNLAIMQRCRQVLIAHVYMYVQQCASAFKLLCSVSFYGLKKRLWFLFHRSRSFFVYIYVLSARPECVVLVYDASCGDGASMCGICSTD